MKLGRGASRDLCAGLLKAAGLRLIERNWRCRMGEIDLIAEESGTLVFAEVRMRQSGNYGGAAESVTAAKRARCLPRRACTWPASGRALPLRRVSHRRRRRACAVDPERVGE